MTLNASGRDTPINATLKIVASATANGKTLSAHTEVNLVVTDPSAPQADVFFVLDVTGSMTWAINGIRDGISNFAATMRAKKIDFRIGLLAFRDLTYDAVPMDLLLFDGQPFTNNVEAFQDQVGGLVSMGGGDEPESSLEAVVKACRQPFRKSATKVLLLITDAPPKVKPAQNIPQTDEEELAGAEKAAAVVRENGIDAVNLVVRPDDPRNLRFSHDLTTYTPLMQAGQLKGAGKFFDLKKTVAAGPAGFTSLINQFTSSVVEAAAAKNPSTPVVSGQADKPVITTASLQSSQKFAEGYEGRLFC